MRKSAVTSVPSSVITYESCYSDRALTEEGAATSTICSWAQKDFLRNEQARAIWTVGEWAGRGDTPLRGSSSAMPGSWSVSIGRRVDALGERRGEADGGVAEVDDEGDG